MPKDVMCKQCNNFVHDWCEKVFDSPFPDIKRDCQYFSQKTNADRIRAMSDVELAENLCDKRLTKEMWLEWLKQPVKEE